MQKQQAIATWNQERDLWETSQMDIFGHSDVYVETWPKSGMTRDGQLFESPSWEGATTAQESSSSRSLPTPMAHHSGNSPEEHLRKKPGRKRVTDLSILVENDLLRTGGELPENGPHFPTPKAADGIMGRPRTTGRPIEKSTHLGTIVTLLPTPDATMAERGAQKNLSKFRPSGHRRQIKLNDLPTMLPTPNTMDSLPAREGEARERQLRRGDPNGSRRKSMGNLREDIVSIDLDGAAEIMASRFGPYSDAVHSWEKVTRPAPDPTQPNTKGKPQLAAAFAEWMMGLPEGWVTSPEIGLSRAQQLKAIGNGVCVQQAEAALRILLDGLEGF